MSRPKRRRLNSAEIRKIRRAYRLFRFVHNFIVYLMCMAGCLFQAALICQDYFSYPTVTDVTVIAALPLTNYPQMAFCAEWVVDSYHDTIDIFHQHINPPSGTFPWGNASLGFVDIIRSHFKSRSTKNPLHPCIPEEEIAVDKFIQKRGTCVSFRSRKPLNMKPTELFRNPADRVLEIKIDLLKPITGFHVFMESNKTSKITFHIYMTAYESDFDAPFLIPVTRVAHKTIEQMINEFSFTQKVMKRYPPPYDTNCRDYRKDGLTSQASCTRKCINEWTIDNGLIFEDHVISEDVINRFRTLQKPLLPLWFAFKDEDMTMDYLTNMTKNLSHHAKTPRQLLDDMAWSEDDATREQHSASRFSPEMESDLKPLVSIFPDLQQTIKKCEMECRQPDCLLEYIIPYGIHYERVGEKVDKKGNKDQKKKRKKKKEEDERPKIRLTTGIHAPKEPVVVVSSKEKMILLDFVIYILTILSFWFGFCPLAVAGEDSFLAQKVIPLFYRLLPSVGGGGMKKEAERRFEKYHD